MLSCCVLLALASLCPAEGSAFSEVEEAAAAPEMLRPDHFGMMRSDGLDSPSFLRSDGPDALTSPYFQEEQENEGDDDDEEEEDEEGRELGEEEEMEHLLIPACVLGPELLQRFRSVNPHWRPKDSWRNAPESTRKQKQSCVMCYRSIQQDIVPQSMENSVMMMKPSHLRSMKATPPMEVLSNPSLTKAPQLRANPQVTDPHVILSDNNSALPSIGGQPMKPNTREEYQTGRSVATTTQQQQQIMRKAASDRVHNSPRFKSSGLALIQSRAGESAGLDNNIVSSSDEASDDVLARPRVDDIPPVPMKPGTAAPVKPSKSYVTNSSLKFDDQIMIDNQAMFDSIVATRKLPEGVSLATIDERILKKLLCHFKNYSPPCPHCNSNAFVKFRYFNNMSKSALLQPRYSCKNPETCLIIQEKTGKPGSRDFTLQKPKDAENYEGSQDPSQSLAAKGALAEGSQEKKGTRQPQMIARIGSKRSHHELSSGALTSSHIAKLPNTTLSLQSLTGLGPGIHTSASHSLRIADSFQARYLLQAPKAIEDSNSSSNATQNASDGHLNVDLKCGPENCEGRVIVQPVSLQSLTPIESSMVDPSKGKIAELNIRMFIDLSNTSSC